MKEPVALRPAPAGEEHPLPVKAAQRLREYQRQIQHMQEVQQGYLRGVLETLGLDLDKPIQVNLEAMTYKVPVDEQADPGS